MTEPRHDEPGREAPWSDALRDRLHAARDSDRQQSWARWEAAALRELSKASLDEVSWEIADGVSLPPLVDEAIEAVLGPALERSAARGALVRDPGRAWDVLRTRDGLHPDESSGRSAWEERLGVTKIRIEATHADLAALDPAKWSSVIAPGLAKELRVGSWSSAFAEWSEVVVDPVAATLTRGGDSASLAVAREETIALAGASVRYGVDGRSVHEAGGDVLDELAAVLGQVSSWLRAAERRGRPAREVFRRLDVDAAIGREPLVEIAKLRAIRGALAAMAAACGVSLGDLSIRVVGHGSRRELTRRDPWVNLLRGTMAGVAGVLGGVDGLEIQPLDLLDAEHGEFGARMAIDTHRLLRDEAHLAVTADAAAGSHAIEAATEALASAAWRRFQEIEAAGGFDAWLAAGGLHTTVALRAEALGARVRAGERVLLGSNLHPPRDVHEVPKGEWAMPAPSRAGSVSREGDVLPLAWISLEASLTTTSTASIADVSTSSQGAA